MKYWMALTASLAVVALFVSAAAIGQSDDGGSAAPVTSQPSVVQVELGELFIKPNALQLAAATPVRIEVHNGGRAQHNFALQGVAATKLLAAGERATLEVPALDAGVYTFLCEVAGHASGGMQGTLTVGDGGATANHGTTAGHMTAEQMDASYMAGVQAFPAKTERLGGLPYEPQIVDRVKVFDLTAAEIDWEVSPGEFKKAMAYNGMVPGPEIRVRVGDRVRVVLHNNLNESTAIHFHGQQVPNDQDGVPGITQPLVKPGESYTYEFTVRNAGSHMYHSHMNGATQIPAGLLGAFIVEDGATPQAALDTVMVLNDGPLGYTLNGKSFPATQPIVLQQGQVARIRYMNEGLQIHPMHLHGLPQTVIMKDGYPLAQPYVADTVLVAPGERIDVLITGSEAGVWAFHCHILSHAETEAGMYGMVTAVVVQE